MKRRALLLVLPTFLFLSSCNLLYYAAMEKLGREKRDILVKRILTVKKDQQQTEEQLMRIPLDVNKSSRGSE